MSLRVLTYKNFVLFSSLYISQLDNSKSNEWILIKFSAGVYSGPVNSDYIWGLYVLVICTSFFNFFGCVTDDFGVARRKAKKAEQTSDIDTAASEVEKESRKRRAKAFLDDDESVCSVRNGSNSKKGSGKNLQLSAALLSPPPPPAALTTPPPLTTPPRIIASTSTPSVEARHRLTPPIPAAPITSPRILASTPAAGTSLNARMSTACPDATQASKRGMKQSGLLCITWLSVA